MATTSVKSALTNFWRKGKEWESTEELNRVAAYTLLWKGQCSGLNYPRISAGTLENGCEKITKEGRIN